MVLLAARDRTLQELSRRLAAKGFALSEVKGAIDRLTEQGYLDDRRFATIWARGRLETQPMGPLRLRRELEAKGVDQDLVREVLRDIYEDGEEQAARRAVAGRWDRLQRFRATSRTARMARFLQRRGFSTEVIWRLLREDRQPDRGNQ